MADLLKELDTTERKTELIDLVFAIYIKTPTGIAIPVGVLARGQKYAEHDGKFTFEGFLKAMKDDEDMNELLLKISNV